MDFEKIPEKSHLPACEVAGAAAGEVSAANELAEFAAIVPK